MDLNALANSDVIKLVGSAMKEATTDMLKEVIEKSTVAKNSDKCPFCGKRISRIKVCANKLEKTSPILGHILNHKFGVYDASGNIRKTTSKSSKKGGGSKKGKASKNTKKLTKGKASKNTKKLTKGKSAAKGKAAAKSS